jgi:hypothetical protein
MHIANEGIIRQDTIFLVQNGPEQIAVLNESCLFSFQRTISGSVPFSTFKSSIETKVGSPLLGVHRLHSIFLNIISYLHNIFPLLVRIGFCYEVLLPGQVKKTNFAFSVAHRRCFHNVMGYVLSACKIQDPAPGSKSTQGM